MTPDFKQDYFALFGLSAAFRIDAAKLDSTYRIIQSQVHPDRYVHLPETERRLFMQQTTRVNEAYYILKNPLKRACYLLQLAGMEAHYETNTAMPAEFLLEQLEWREAVAEARAAGDHHELERLMLRLQHQSSDLRCEIEREIDKKRNYLAAADAVCRLMFIEKLEQEIDEALEALEA